MRLTQRTNQCNQMLMESYGIDGQTEILAGVKNYVCAGINNNCCSLQSQLTIFKKYFKNDEIGKVKRFYRKFELVFENIFNAFEKVEKIAEMMKPFTSDYRNSNCLKLVNTVLKVQASRYKEDLMSYFKRSADFYIKSHSGFYCSLCDADAHRFFVAPRSMILETKYFCQRMVEETLNWSLYRSSFFPKISRLYSTLLVSCDARAKFNPKGHLPAKIRFFNRPKIGGPVNKCAFGIERPFAFGNCKDYCNKFNPTRYNPLLMGEYAKLLELSSFFKREIWKHNKKRRNYDKDESDVAAENDPKKSDGFRNPTGRVLEDGGSHESHEDEEDSDSSGNDSPPAVHQDESLDTLNDFNRRFETSIIKPILYKFKEDLSLNIESEYGQSIWDQGITKVYDVGGWKIDFMDEGLDPFNYGELTQIDYENAVFVFEELYPSESRDALDNN